MRRLNKLLLAAGVAIAIPVSAQDATRPASPPAAGDNVVEGATADRVQQVERCSGHKFDSIVQIDPVRKRSTRVKLCANPGATDAEWVKTLEAAVVQIEQRAMPEEAKDKLIAELRAEIAKFAPARAARTQSQSADAFVGNLGGIGKLAPTNERYEVSTLPPLPAPLPRKSATSLTAASGSGASALPPVPAIRFRVKCLARGETGAGATCDFFESGTVLALSAIDGLDKGATLRFRRKGEVRGEVPLAPLGAGQSVRVKLPADLCRGVSFTRIELEMLAPKSTAIAGRAGPYEMRC